MTTAYAPSLASAPASITPRDISFDVDASRIGDWGNGDVIRTTWSNALSLLFPGGERFFITSVAAFRNVLTDPEKLAEVKAFVTQEGLHTREHLAYNQLMRGLVDVDAIEAKQAAKIELVRKSSPPIVQLAATVAFEHFTAILAHDFLKRPEYLQGVVPSYARLWVWHAIEECEHKAVAFDVYAAATQGKGDLKRRLTMIGVTIDFLQNALTNCYQIFEQAGTHKSPATWAKLAWYLFGAPGVLRRVIPSYLQFYRSDFHPAQIDDSRERNAGLAYLSVT